jgi:hypothetical protein
MELKKELLEFLEANNLFGLEDRGNAEGVVDSYLKVYKKQLTLTDVVHSGFYCMDAENSNGSCHCPKQCNSCVVY